MALNNQAKLHIPQFSKQNISFNQREVSVKDITLCEVHPICVSNQTILIKQCISEDINQPMIQLIQPLRSKPV